MQIWTHWLETLQALLLTLSTDLGVSVGVAIVLLTLLLRLTLLPASWYSAYFGCIHQKKTQKIQPKMARLRERYRNDPQLLTEKIAKLYQDHNVSLLPGRSLVGGLLQFPVFLAMFQILQDVSSPSRFLWISNLSRPDFWLALLAGLATALMMAANPELSDQTRVFMIVVPSLITFLVALNFSSGLAVYWVTSNLFTAVHTVAVHACVNKRIRDGKVCI